MAWTHLSTVEGSGTSLNFTSISQSYKHLMFKGHGSSSGRHNSSTQYEYDYAEITFNSDSTQYDYQYCGSLYNNALNWSGGGNLANKTSISEYCMIQYGDTWAGTGTQQTPCFGDFEFWIFDYTASGGYDHSYHGLFHCVGDNDTDYWGRGAVWGVYSGGAITSVEFGLEAGSWESHSVISMYGLEGT